MFNFNFVRIAGQFYYQQLSGGGGKMADQGICVRNDAFPVGWSRAQ